MTKANEIKEAVEMVAKENNRPLKAHWCLYIEATNELHIKTGKQEKAAAALKAILKANGGKHEGDISERINAEDSKNALEIFNAIHEKEAELKLTRNREKRPQIEAFDIFGEDENDE